MSSISCFFNLPVAACDVVSHDNIIYYALLVVCNMIVVSDNSSWSNGNGRGSSSSGGNISIIIIQLLLLPFGFVSVNSSGLTVKCLLPFLFHRCNWFSWKHWCIRSARGLWCHRSGWKHRFQWWHRFHWSARYCRSNWVNGCDWNHWEYWSIWNSRWETLTMSQGRSAFYLLLARTEIPHMGLSLAKEVLYKCMVAITITKHNSWPSWGSLCASVLHSWLWIPLLYCARRPFPVAWTFHSAP